MHWIKTSTVIKITTQYIFLTTNYILHAKKDLSPWKEVLGKYFYVKDFVKDFQVEWPKMTPEWNVKRFFDIYYKDLKKPD